MLLLIRIVINNTNSRGGDHNFSGENHNNTTNTRHKEARR